MRVPSRLSNLVEEGIVDEVVRPLRSGKEAEVYLVRVGGVDRVAKIYKEADQRSFKHRSDYTEGRRVRNARDRRAMDKRSRYGRAQAEGEWRAVEVDVIYRLEAAGVRVPQPIHYVDGVLVMELVMGVDDRPAPRIADVDFSPEEATAIYLWLLGEVVRMLCAGVVHGDLSEFNVLYGAEGPVVIDFPQAIDPAKNSQARTLLLRDVDNLHRFLRRAIPGSPKRPFGEEIWELFQRNELTPQAELRGEFRPAKERAPGRAQPRQRPPAPPAQGRRRSGGGPKNTGRAHPEPEVIVKRGTGPSTTAAPREEPRGRRRSRRRTDKSKSPATTEPA